MPPRASLRLPPVNGIRFAILCGAVAADSDHRDPNNHAVLIQAWNMLKDYVAKNFEQPDNSSGGVGKSSLFDRMDVAPPPAAPSPLPPGPTPDPTSS